MGYQADPEANLLHALLTTDMAQIDLVASVVRPEHFQVQDFANLYRAMLWLRDNGQPLDFVGLYEGLRHLKVSEESSNMAVANIFDAIPLVGYATKYAKAVKERAREVSMAKSMSLAQIRVADGEDVDSVRKELIEKFEQLDMDSEQLDDATIWQAGDKVLANLYDRMHGDDSKLGLKTGIPALDGMTAGINRGELWIVGGMPGRGKTALALQIADAVVGIGKSVYLVSLEMSKSLVYERMLRMSFGGSVKNPNPAVLEKLIAYQKDLESVPLFIYEGSTDINEIVAKSRSRILRSKIDLVIVDYIQLARCKGIRDIRERVSEVTDNLRRLAKETGVPVVALSQLRRPQDIDDRPSMIDLKESGDIEAHAHVVLLLYFPQSDERRGEDEIIIAKQREGPVGKVNVAFHGDRCRFVERWTHADV